MKKIVKAVITLTSFSLVDRVLGFLFKIYLSREMGASALGQYQVALSFFFVLMTFTTSGLPLVEGKMTATFLERGEDKTDSLITAGVIINLTLSALLTVACIALISPISHALGSDESTTAFIALLPAIFFCSLAAALRGRLWGKENYATLSVIEVAEQVVRIIICVALFVLGMQKIFAATLSLTVAVGVSAFLTVLAYRKKGGRLASPKGQIKPLLSSSVPISAMRASSSLVGSLLAVVVPFLFQTSGNTRSEALALYGATMGMAMPLVFLPLTVIGSLSYAMIPSLAKASASNNALEVKRQSENAVGFSVVIASLAIPLFFGVGKPCGIILYDNEVAGEFMEATAWLLIPVALESITSSMMNSLGMEKQGFINYLLGSAVMLGVMFAFYGNFTPSTLCLAHFVSLVFSTALDCICIRKKTGFSFSFLFKTAECLCLALPCAYLAKWTYGLRFFLPDFVAVILAGALGSGGMVLLFMTFGMLGSYSIRTKKRTFKCAKTFAKKSANMI